jgi:hypothetical protein
LEHIYSEITRQFEKKGLAVTDGVAVDPKLVKLQRRPVTKEKETQRKINFT